MCRSKGRLYTIKIYLCFSEENKFVIICLCDLISPSNISTVSQKKISYFGSRKKVFTILSKKMRLGNFYKLGRICCFSQKNIKIEIHTLSLCCLQNRESHFSLFFLQNRVQSSSGRIKVKTCINVRGDGVPECVSVCMCVCWCVSACLYGLHIIGRE